MLMMRVAEGEVQLSPRLVVEMRPDTLTSKTFLARLCEQAERYDGSSFRFMLAVVSVADIVRLIRDGQLHEGTLIS